MVTTRYTDTLNKLVLMLLLFMCSTQYLFAADISVRASRNPVALDDSFHIIYEADSDVDGKPDFSPVYQYFDVLSSSQSTSMQSINGNWKLKKSWDLSVIARDVGTFTIPPITFGRDISPSIKITVASRSSRNSAPGQGQGQGQGPGQIQGTVPAEIFLESTLDKKTGWVQQQFIYTTRLLRTVSIANASLTDPELSDPDAIMQMIGEDEYQTTRSGIQYQVYERRYAIYPQNSGTLKISAMRFDGRINATQARTIFDQFRMSGQRKRLLSNPLEATIKPVPGNIPLQDWLPARDVRLIEEWSDDIQNLTAGEPVTRTITLIAEGLSGVQLGDLGFDDIPGLKMYPDKPSDDDKVTYTGITGTKTYKVAIIPTAAGQYTIPAITLPWWNTRSDRAEQAGLPETQLNVRPAAGTQTTPVQQAPLAGQQAVTPQDGDTGSTSASNGADSGPGPQATGTAETTAQDRLWRYGAILFAAAWLITALLLLREKRLVKTGRSQAPASLNSLAGAVRKAAKANDAEATRVAMITWARSFYADAGILNLSHINAHCSAGLAEQLRQLSQALYAEPQTQPYASNWHGDGLLGEFDIECRERPKHDAGNTQSVLKPLYSGKQS